MGRTYSSEEWGRQELFAVSDGPRTFQPLQTALQREDKDIALFTSEERYRYTLALSPLILWVADAGGGMIDIDARGLDYTGLTHDACMGTGFLDAIHDKDRPTVKRIWQGARLTGDALDYEIRLRDANGKYRWHRVRAAARRDDGGRILCWYGTIEDVDDRKHADEAIRWAADHDDLTGLWNRGAFMRALRTALTGAEGSGVDVALLLLDLDQFKALNDQHGHSVGDALLQELARRLDTSGTGDAMAARLGGDEFALFIYMSDRQQFDERIATLQQVLSAPYFLHGETHICRASIGVALYPGHGEDADALYRNADLALYEAKNAAMGLCFFRDYMRAGLQKRMSQIAMARHALDHDQIVPFYQPKVSLSTGAIVGFEALLRWTSDTHGIQTPGSIPAAFEDAELAIALDERIFDRLTCDIAAWLGAGLSFGRIAFNISSADFRREGFVKRLLARMERAKIPATALELEVTETVFLGKSPKKVTAIFERLRAAGLTIALDDFGTGYASLVHLKQFPIDVLKVDCSFIREMANPANAAIVRAIIGLGNDLGITTVAEGIETKAQADQLHRKGCDVGQGFLFSPAVPAAEVPSLLARGEQPWVPADRRRNPDRRKDRARKVEQ